MKILLDILKLLIVFIFLAAITSSCVTEKKRQEICASCDIKEKIHDTIWKDKPIVKIDSFYKFITGPIVYHENPCSKWCDSLGNLKSFKHESSHNGIKQSIESKGNVIIQKCNVDSLLNIQKTLEQTINRLQKTTIEKAPIVKNELKSWQIFLCFSGLIMWILILVSIILIIRNKFKK